MKKTILIAFLAMLTLGFTACKKDTKAVSSLVNTTWLYQDASGTESLFFEDNQNLTITDSSAATMFSTDATYSYNAPNITINFLGYTYTGTVSGDKMNLSDGTETKTYNKQ